MNNRVSTKKDWKIFRERIAGWQEAYMDRLNKEYIELLSGDGAPSDKFWKLEKRIREDRKSPGVIVEIGREELEHILIGLMADEVITEQDLEGFGDELKARVLHMVELWRRDESESSENDPAES